MRVTPLMKKSRFLLVLSQWIIVLSLSRIQSRSETLAPDEVGTDERQVQP